MFIDPQLDDCDKLNDHRIKFSASVIKDKFTFHRESPCKSI